MGRAERIRPKRLGQKLAAIRKGLKIETLEEMIAHLNQTEIPLHRSNVSAYEKGKREPPLIILLRYAHLANVYADVLIDDNLDLPEILPSKQKSAGTARADEPVKRKSGSGITEN